MKKCIHGREVEVHMSGAGYFIGVWDEEGPFCRASGYYRTRAEATTALENGFVSRIAGEIVLCNGGQGCNIRDTEKEENKMRKTCIDCRYRRPFRGGLPKCTLSRRWDYCLPNRETCANFVPSHDNLDSRTYRVAKLELMLKEHQLFCSIIRYLIDRGDEIHSDIFMEIDELELHTRKIYLELLDEGVVNLRDIELVSMANSVPEILDLNSKTYLAVDEECLF